MNTEDFRKYGHKLIDWMADYLDNVEDYPVKSQVKPGDIKSKIPDSPPAKGQDFQSMIKDLDEIIMPGITHWQHPGFFGYFPANSSRISVLAEMITSTLAAQCMMWDTSPAAAELEEKVMQWLGDMIGLPKSFSGVIQDSASTATLVSLITAREKFTNFDVNHSGLQNQNRLIVYCSYEAHSSVEKAIKVAGLGKENLRKLPVDDTFALIPDELEKAINKDLENGYQPMAVIAAIGTTGSTAIDPLKQIGAICKKYSLWLHVDAALAGTACILPEMRWMIDGIEYADSFVFNPHKWMFTNFDCSAYFVQDEEALINTFEIMPEYLKTKTRGVKNYRDWGIQLGRRFRALKLWFVIRNYGIDGLQEKIKYHLELTKIIREEIEKHGDFEILAPVPLNTICFRYHPAHITDEEKLNTINEELLDKINATGKVFMTHTKLNGRFVIRIVVGQTEVCERHVRLAWDIIRDCL